MLIKLVTSILQGFEQILAKLSLFSFQKAKLVVIAMSVSVGASHWGKDLVPGTQARDPDFTKA